MISFVRFARGVGAGLLDAIKSDVDVFLIASSALLWPFKVLRGLFIGTLLYVVCRRLDGLMSGYISIKNKEMNVINEAIKTNQD